MASISFCHILPSEKSGLFTTKESLAIRSYYGHDKELPVPYGWWTCPLPAPSDPTIPSSLKEITKVPKAVAFGFAKPVLPTTGHHCITTMSPILSHLHQLFNPNHQAMSHFVKTQLQLTSEDLHFLRAITASYKIWQMSDPNSSFCRPPFPCSPGQKFSLQNWLATFLYPYAYSQVHWVPLGLGGHLRVGTSPTTNKRAQTFLQIILCIGIPANGSMVLT